MVERRVLQCGLCRSKEKCLKPGLKCVNRWSSSTVQRKRVPESWGSRQRNDEQQCPSCAAELTETSVWTTAENDKLSAKVYKWKQRRVKHILIQLKQTTTTTNVISFYGKKLRRPHQIGAHSVRIGYSRRDQTTWVHVIV